MNGNGKSVIHMEITNDMSVTNMKVGGTLQNLLYGACVIVREICEEAGLDRRDAWKALERAMDSADAAAEKDKPRLWVLKGEDNA